MHACDVLGSPVRRRILELLADGERSSGEVTQRVQEEFGITQSAVSQHLKVLKDAGLVTDRADGTRRIYTVDQEGLGMLRDYLDQFWSRSLANFKSAAEQEDS